MDITPKHVHRKCSVMPGRTLMDLKALSISLESDTICESPTSTTPTTNLSDYFCPSLMTLKAVAPDRNIIGFVQQDVLTPSQGYLEVQSGDAMLIIDERDDYYVAKPIGKLGIPGKILKSLVKLQPTTPAWDEFPSSPITPLMSPTTGGGFSPRNGRKNHSMMSLKTGSKFGTLRRGSLQQKPLYATLGLFGIDTNNPFEPIPDVFGQVTSLQLIVIDRIEYIEFKIDTQDTPDSHIFRRLQDIATLHAQIAYEFTHELNKSPLFSLPSLPVPCTDTDSYLIDIDCFIADLVFLSSEIPIQPLLEDFFQTQPNDTSLRQLTKQTNSYYTAPRIKSLVLLDPIEPVPPLSPDFVTSSNLYSIDTEFVNENYYQQQLTSLKIKLEFDGNLFAFKLQNSEISYSHLQHQILNRVGHPPTAIHLRDPHTRRLGLLTEELFTNIINTTPSHIYLIITLNPQLQ